MTGTGGRPYKTNGILLFGIPFVCNRPQGHSIVGGFFR